MATLTIKSDINELAQTAAKLVAQQLNDAITASGSAVWVLAGGTAPMGAYAILARDYRDRIDWAHVTVLLGDERCVPTHHPDSNWYQISQTLLDHVPIAERNKLRPSYELAADEAAQAYEAAVKRLVTNDDGIPHFDVVWLGMGEDGHTLSLFPAHAGLKNTEQLVISIHDSPKPPPDRISLTLNALQNVSHCTVMAAGSGKAGIIAQAMRPDTTLPIVQAVQTIENNGAQVMWLLDTAAAEQL